MDNFNRLTPAQAERLSILLEELGESIQIIGKIQRHGYESRDPTRSESPTNRTMLEKELGDVQAAMELLVTGEDISATRVTKRIRKKLEKLEGYQHHNGDTIRKELG